MNKLKKLWKQLFCNHYYVTCLRWHWTHYPNDYDLRSVEIEYQCNNCGKIFYLHLFGNEAYEWSFVMGDYLLDGMEEK